MIRLYEGVSQSKTFQFLDDRFYNDTNKIDTKYLCDLIIIQINNTKSLYDAMYDYTITKRNTVHFNSTIRALVWKGFKDLVNDGVYYGSANDSSISEHLQKWLKMRTGQDKPAYYSVLDYCYKYYEEERKEREQEILEENI